MKLILIFFLIFTNDLMSRNLDSCYSQAKHLILELKNEVKKYTNDSIIGYDFDKVFIDAEKEHFSDSVLFYLSNSKNINNQEVLNILKCNKNYRKYNLKRIFSLKNTDQNNLVQFSKYNYKTNMIFFVIYINMNKSHKEHRYFYEVPVILYCYIFFKNNKIEKKIIEIGYT